MNKQMGLQSLFFEEAPFIISGASIVGKKEGEGPLGDKFDVVGTDDLFGSKTWEEAESCLQKDAVALALGKKQLKKDQIRYLFAGDLLGQSIASTYGLMDYEIPLFGLFGACSTCGLSLSLGAMSIAAGYANKVVCVTSSHFASAEKEFRFPLAYGNQRPPASAWTVTGSGAFVLSKQNQEAIAKITGITTGKVVDMGIKDSFNMGCAMAPAAAATIAANLKDFERKPEDYDRIITGDLGTVGQTALLKILREQGIDIEDRHMDCGIEIYDTETQDVGSGGSGCGCSATVLAAYILPEMQKGTWKRILFVPTGALLSKTSFNEGNSVPGIAHAVVIEVVS